MQKRAVGLLAAAGHLLPEAFDHVAVILHHHVSEHTVGLRAVALFPEIRLEKKEFFNIRFVDKTIKNKMANLMKRLFDLL